MKYLKRVKDFIGSKLKKPKPEEPKMTPQAVKDILRNTIDMSIIEYVEYLCTEYEDQGYDCAINVFSIYDNTVIDVPFYDVYHIYKNHKLNTNEIKWPLRNIYMSIEVSVNGTYGDGCYEVAQEIVQKISKKYPEFLFDSENSESYGSDGGYNISFKIK